MVLPETVMMPKCSGALALMGTELSAAAPKLLPPDLSHSRPIRVSQPSGAESSLSRCARQVAMRCFHWAVASAAFLGAAEVWAGSASAEEKMLARRMIRFSMTLLL